MKRDLFKSSLIVALMALVVSSCKKDDDINFEPIGATKESVAVDVAFEDRAAGDKFFNVDSKGVVTLKPGTILVGNVNIPNKGKILADEIFSNQKKMVTIKLNNVEVIGREAFLGTDNLTSVEWGKTKWIGENAFTYAGLTSINLVKIEEIGPRAFMYCNNLQSVDIKSVKKVGKGAFYSTTLLQTISFGEVGMLEDLFDDCRSLQTLTIRNKQTPPVITNDFTLPGGVEVIVPVGMKAKYAKDKYWSKFINQIKEM